MFVVSFLPFFISTRFWVLEEHISSPRLRFSLLLAASIQRADDGVGCKRTMQASELDAGLIGCCEWSVVLPFRSGFVGAGGRGPVLRSQRAGFHICIQHPTLERGNPKAENGVHQVLWAQVSACKEKERMK